MSHRKHIVFDDVLNEQIVDLAKLEDRHFAYMVRQLCREAIFARTREADLALQSDDAA